jgi:hypothetical protein
VSNQYRRPEYADAYRLALSENRLYLASPAVVAWSFERAGVTSRLAIHGTPVDPATGDDVVAFVSIQFENMNPLVSVALIWEGARILGIDMGGSAHRNLRGRPVPTPHRHLYRPNGHLEAEPFDWAGVGIAKIDDHPAVLRHFLDWVGLDGNQVEWHNPPPMQPPRYGSDRRKQS